MSHADDEEADTLRNLLTVLVGDSTESMADDVMALPGDRRANVMRIGKIALKRLGDNVSGPGGIPPRILGILLREGSFIREPVSSAYWGGILACSRSLNPRDDRAARWLRLLLRLGEYDMRSHYLFYSSMRFWMMRHREPARVDFAVGKTMNYATFLPGHYYLVGMDFNEDETANMPKLVSGILYSLGQEHLVAGSNQGPDYYLNGEFRTNTTGVIRGEGIVFTPSVLGVRLFLGAFGYRDADERFLLDPRLECGIEGVPRVVDFSGLVYQPEESGAGS